MEAAPVYAGACAEVDEPAVWVDKVADDKADDATPSVAVDEVAADKQVQDAKK